MNLPSIKLKINFVDIILIILGSAMYAAAFDFFLQPNNIAPGGITGLSMVINHLLPIFPVGALIITFNTPLFFISWRSEGHNFLIKSLIGMLTSSVFIDLFKGLYSYTDDFVMASISGGVLMGIGMGLIFMRGGTTGGSDIIARLLGNKFTGVSIGRLILAVDAVIISFSAFVFGHINYALYAIVTVFIATIVIDKILTGVDSAQVAYIITKNTDLVTETIIRELDRGVTLLHGEGAFTHDKKNIIMCAIKRRQIAALKTIVRAADPTSFVILMEAHEVFGEGFRDHIKKKE